MKVIWVPFGVLCIPWLIYFTLFCSEFTCLDRLVLRRWPRYLLMLILLVAGLAIGPRLSAVLLSFRAAPKTNALSSVWVNTRTGFYYCPGSRLYRKVQPGKHMRQPDALQSGYQPSLGEACR